LHFLHNNYFESIQNRAFYAFIIYVSIFASVASKLNTEISIMCSIFKCQNHTLKYFVRKYWHIINNFETKEASYSVDDAAPKYIYYIF